MDALYWLPVDPSPWRILDLKEAQRRANCYRDLGQTVKLDRIAQKLARDGVPDGLRRVSMLLLSSCTVSHLVPALRVSALARGIWLDVEVGDYGIWRHDIMAREGSYDFVLLALDASTLPTFSLGIWEDDHYERLLRAVGELYMLWETAARRFGGRVIQQTIINRAPKLFGSYEIAVPGAARTTIDAFNGMMMERAADSGTLFLDLTDHDSWHDPIRWVQGKLDVSPAAAPVYGDLVARTIAAALGLSKKVAVLDLDNTLWGGIVGDDGVEGLRLGQGDPVGEAHLAFQHYLKRLSERGIVLAVCSKNENAAAELGFTHPEMILKSEDIAAFVANWDDKAHNVRGIAQALDLGLDSFVFIDDNPAERAIVRQELPMVFVPELPFDPALYAYCIADSGCFEATTFTIEDAQRTQQYRLRATVQQSLESATDMDAFLASLEMEMEIGPFQPVDVPRIAQLTNKSNQYNLTTVRTTEDIVRAQMTDGPYITVQARLRDKYGDHGLISVAIAEYSGTGENAFIISWLMSCRVLKRDVEIEVLNYVAEQAKALGCKKLIGTYIPSAKNEMVRDHYQKLGFERVEDSNAAHKSTWTWWQLDLQAFEPLPTHIERIER